MLTAGRWCWYADAARRREVASIGYEARAREDGTGSVVLGNTWDEGEAAERLRYAVGLQATRPH